MDSSPNLGFGWIRVPLHSFSISFLSLWLLAEFNQWQQKVIGEKEKSLSSSVALLPQLWLALHKNTAHSGWPIPYSFKHGVTMNIPKAKTYMCNHSLFVSLTLLAPL